MGAGPRGRGDLSVLRPPLGEDAALVGLIGAGSMARALARGWGQPVLCTDAGSGRARELVAEVGGRAMSGNAALAEQARFVVLCHKPSQLEAVASEVDGRARAVVSILSGVTLATLNLAYRRTPVLRLAVNLPVEVRLGTVCYAGASGASVPMVEEIVQRFSELGVLLRLDEQLVPAAIALSGVGPAYLSLVVEAQVEAAVRHGLPADQAADLVLQTMTGTAALLRWRGSDTAGLRRSIASPGGPTAAGLGALERAGIRGMFRDALDTVVGMVEATEVERGRRSVGEPAP